MTPEQIDIIEARANAATPGPWEWWAGNPWHATAPNHPLRDGNAPVVVQTGMSGDGFFYKPGVQEQAKADLAFIADARQDIPVLVAEVRRLQREIEELEESRQWDTYGEDL